MLYMTDVVCDVLVCGSVGVCDMLVLDVLVCVTCCLCDVLVLDMLLV